MLIIAAACTGGAVTRLISTLRFSVVGRMESGTFEDDTGARPDHFFSRIPAFGAFSLSSIIHLMEFIKFVTAISASVFVSWHHNPFQSISIIVIAREGQTFMQAAHPEQPCFTYAFPLTSILILR